MIGVMINEKDIAVPLLIAIGSIGFPLGIYGLYCSFAAMHHRKPSHPYWQSIYAPASEFTEVGAKYRKRYFRIWKILVVLFAIPIILSIAGLIR
jgi:hypothetical protein